MVKFTIEDGLNEMHNDNIKKEIVTNNQVNTILEDKKEVPQYLIDGKYPASRAQVDIFNFIKFQVAKMRAKLKPDNLIIEAGAGCSKSTTLVESLKLIPIEYNVSLLAFNKDIVDVIRPKVPMNCRVQTFHSAGLGAYKYVHKNVQVNNNKMYEIFTELTSKYTKQEVDELLSPFIKLCSLVKNTCVDPTTDNLEMIISKYSLDIDIEASNLFDLVREGMIRSKYRTDVIDYDDMIYMPVILRLSFYKQRVLCIDETQDLNEVQLRMLKMMIRTDGFIILVGDSNQAIYMFRGACSDSMNKMQKELNCKTLPLMVTYRCAKKIVQFANRIVPELQAFEGNPEGEVNYINMDKFYEIITEGDGVLCRNTAPLLPPVFHLLSKGIKVSIKGRDIGENLKKVVLKLKANGMKDFYLKLENWKLKEDERATIKKSANMKQTTMDKYECLLAISDECDNVKDIITKIENIFSDTNKSPIDFATIHRFKGLERKRIFILAPELMPSKYALTNEALIQERDIVYVGITRPKISLFIVNGVINFSAFDSIGFSKKV